MEALSSIEPVRRTLTFRIGDERFAVAAGLVREVTRMPRFTRVPHAPASLIGIGNFRGSVLPIVSFAKLTDRPATDERRVIVLDTASPLALAVEDVTALGREDAPLIDIENLTARSFASGHRKARAAAMVAQSAAREAEDAVLLMSFDVAGQDFALPISAVEEVLRLPDHVALLPHADAAVLGSIAVRDALLPLLSLQTLLALPLPDDYTVRHGRVVVVKIGAQRVGLVVDAMRAILRVPESRIDAVPAVLSRGSAEARIQAICRIEDGQRLISVLAVEHLVREDLTASLLQGAETTMAEQKAAEATEQFLLFRIGSEEFGLPVDAVIEVARLPARLTRLPKAPPFVLGVMNLRGQVIPVIDQASRFGDAMIAGGSARIIVVRLGTLQAAFAVDAITEVIRVPTSALGPAPDLGGGDTRVFDRIVHIEASGRMVLIVSPQELLDRAERDMLRKLSRTAPAALS